MSTLTVADLKERLKDRNLPTTGTKAELVKRLLEAGVSHEELGMSQSPSEHDEFTSDPQTGTSTQANTLSCKEIELLWKERDLATREAELLRRELELLRMTPQSEANVSTRIGVKKWKELENMIGEFSGNSQDLDRWEKQVRKLLASYALDEHQAKALVCSRLSSKALKWYHSRADCVEVKLRGSFTRIAKNVRAASRSSSLETRTRGKNVESKRVFFRLLARKSNPGGPNTGIGRRAYLLCYRGYSESRVTHAGQGAVLQINRRNADCIRKCIDA